MIKPTLPRDLNAEEIYINIADGWLVSAKLDGVRCIATRDGLFTRNGKRITCLPEIAEEFAGCPEGVFYDGELYSFDLDFSRLNALVAMRERTPEHNRIFYAVFDASLIGDDSAPWRERAADIGLLDVYNIGNFGGMRGFSARVMCVVHALINDSYELEQAYKKALNHGYEGLILRDPRAPYIQGRTDRLLKLKPTKDAEFKITNIKPDKTGLKAGAVVCVTEAGRSFGAGIGAGLDDADKRALLRNRRKLIGKMATIQFQELTPRGVPRFPKFLGIRCDI